MMHYALGCSLRLLVATTLPPAQLFACPPWRSWKGFQAFCVFFLKWLSVRFLKICLFPRDRSMVHARSLVQRQPHLREQPHLTLFKFPLRIIYRRAQCSKPRAPRSIFLCVLQRRYPEARAPGGSSCWSPGWATLVAPGASVGLAAPNLGTSPTNWNMNHY